MYVQLGDAVCVHVSNCPCIFVYIRERVCACMRARVHLPGASDGKH